MCKVEAIIIMILTLWVTTITTRVRKVPLNNHNMLNILKILENKTIRFGQHDRGSLSCLLKIIIKDKVME